MRSGNEEESAIEGGGGLDQAAAIAARRLETYAKQGGRAGAAGGEKERASQREGASKRGVVRHMEWHTVYKMLSSIISGKLIFDSHLTQKTGRT